MCAEYSLPDRYHGTFGKHLICCLVRRHVFIFTGVAIAGVLCLFALTLFFVATDRSMDIDDGALQMHLQESESLSGFSQNFGKGGGFSRRLFYYLYAWLNVGIQGRRALAACIAAVNLCYIVFIGRRYRLFEGYGHFIPVALIAMNSPFFAFGAYGWMTYPLTVLLSTIFMHIVLFAARQHALTFIHGIAISLMMGGIIVVSVRFILPVVVFLGAYCALRWGYNLGDWKKMCGATLASFFIGLPAIVIAVVMLFFFAHAEFAAPRRAIWPYYFPKTGLSYDLQGAWLFVLSRSERFLQTTFALFRGQDIHGNNWTIYLPDWSMPSQLLAAALVIGLVGSLLRPRRPRFLLALYLSGVWVALIVLGLWGKYAYGHVRYHLFILVPLLVMAALGIQDLVALFQRIGSSFGKKRWVRYAVSCMGLLVFTATVAMYTWSQTTELRYAKHVVQGYTQQFNSMLAAIVEDDSDALIWDHYTIHLVKAVYPEIAYPEIFFFPSAFIWRNPEDPKVPVEEWLAFLDNQTTLLSVTHRDIKAYGAEYYDPLSAYFEEERLPTVPLWNLRRFSRRPLGANLFSNEDSLEPWVTEGGAEFTPGHDGQSVLVNLTPEGGGYRDAACSVVPGMHGVGEVTMWSDGPVEVGVAVAAETVGTLRWYTLSDTPKRYRITHTFEETASSLTLRFQAPEDRGATFKIRDISLGCIDSGE